MAKRLSDTERTVMVCTRVKESQAAKLKKLGGSQWLREQIDKAKLRKT